MNIKPGTKVEYDVGACTCCGREDIECIVTGGGLVCEECIDDSDSADWEPVGADGDAP